MHTIGDQKVLESSPPVFESQALYTDMHLSAHEIE